MDDRTTESFNFLVCYGERRRPVTVSSSASFDDLRLEVVEVFRDVLPCTSSATTQDMASSLILQVKSEEWEGTYVDLKEVPPNKSVLKVVSEPAKVFSYIYIALVSQVSSC